MRYLYYCNSAYQLLNAINLHYNRSFNNFENLEDYHGELLLMNVFAGAEELAAILRNNDIFSRVHVVNKTYNKGSLHVIKNLYDIINPSGFIYRISGIKRKELYNRYNYIVTPKFSIFLAAVWRMNRHAKIQLYEDGIGTYVDSVNLSANSNTYKLLFKIANGGKTFNDFECLYLNNPSLYAGKIRRIKEMPKFDKEMMAKVSKIFSEFNFGKHNKLIWFDQMLSNEENLHSKIRTLLLGYKDDVIYCTHPRHPRDYKEFNTPNKKQIWELACLGFKDINNACLLSIHSTAAFSPKILYNLEPYVIFVYKLTNHYSNNELVDFNKVVERFRELYSDKRKIMIPETFSELEECVANVISDRNKL